MSEILSDCGLRSVRRVVTGHDAQGRAIIALDDVAPTRMIASGDASFLTIWATQKVPADNNDNRDGRDLPTGLTLESGSVIRIVDMLPGGESPMHRTNSIDYGIVLSGDVELELEGGEKQTVREGGIIVQRGTNHLWRNTTTKPCRIVFVLIEAMAYNHAGVALQENKPD